MPTTFEEVIERIYSIRSIKPSHYHVRYLTFSIRSSSWSCCPLDRLPFFRSPLLVSHTIIPAVFYLSLSYCLGDCCLHFVGVESLPDFETEPTNSPMRETTRTRRAGAGKRTKGHSVDRETKRNIDKRGYIRYFRHWHRCPPSSIQLVEYLTR